MRVVKFKASFDVPVDWFIWCIHFSNTLMKNLEDVIVFQTLAVIRARDLLTASVRANRNYRKTS